MEDFGEVGRNSGMIWGEFSAFGGILGHLGDLGGILGI